jgi:hypothetical protein
LIYSTLKGVNESLRGDLDALAAKSDRLRAFFSHNLDIRVDTGKSSSPPAPALSGPGRSDAGNYCG